MLRSLRFPGAVVVAQGPRFVCFYHGWGDQFDGNITTPKLTSELVCPAVSADDKYRVSCMRYGRVCARACVRACGRCPWLPACVLRQRRRGTGWLLPRPPPQDARLLLPCLETVGCVMARERKGGGHEEARSLAGAWSRGCRRAADSWQQSAGGGRRAAAEWRQLLRMC